MAVIGKPDLVKQRGDHAIMVWNSEDAFVGSNTETTNHQGSVGFGIESTPYSGTSTTTSYEVIPTFGVMQIAVSKGVVTDYSIKGQLHALQKYKDQFDSFEEVIDNWREKGYTENQIKIMVKSVALKMLKDQRRRPRFF